MTKQVFKIIGIVLGSVLAFSGAVFGVMAIMGKFSTPDVYPATLYFQTSEMTVGYDASNPDQLYSFVLTGTPDAEYSEYEVNQKTCYIYFESDGADLITFYDKSGNEISPVKNRYEVNCNENIYFKVKSADDSYFDAEDYGTVKIAAYDSRELVKSSNSITINIDRVVKSIQLDSDYEYSFITEKTEEYQNITLSITQSQSFVYSVTPSHSIRPISGFDSKSVELYYIDTKNETDYVLINESNYSNYDFIEYNRSTGEFSFSSENTGTYEFVVAVFASYQDKQNYLALIDGVENVTNITRVSNMVHKFITFNVINTDIEGVELGINAINLNLYTDNNYITLNSSSGSSVTGANDNNLAITMTQNGESTTARFNEIDFALSNGDANWSQSGVSFTTEDGASLKFNSSQTVTIAGLNDEIDGDGYYYSIDFDSSKLTIYKDQNKTETLISLSYTLGSLIVGNRYLVDSMSCTYTSSEGVGVTYDFTSSNGAVFIVNSDETYTLMRLSSGSYIDFFVKNSSTYSLVTQEQFDYSVSFMSGTTLGARTWNIVAKTMPTLTDDESLVFAILVVNANGEYYFVYKPVGVYELSLNYSSVETDKTYELTVNYSTGEAVYPELEFSDIISITSGSYTACVFVTEESESGYDIEVFENLIFVDANGKRYVLVGYLDENGKFVNKVKAVSGASGSGEIIYMLQLKNAYGETTEEYVNRVLQDSFTLIFENSKSETPEALAEVKIADLSSGDDQLLDLVTTYLTSGITINVVHDLSNLTNSSFTFDFAMVEGSNESYLIDGKDGISVVEDEEGYYFEFSSSILDLISNIYATNGYSFSVVMIDASGDESEDSTAINLLTDSITITDGKIKVFFTVGSALTKENAYLKIKMTYNGVSVYSQAIYILSTKATGITFDYKEAGEEGYSSIELDSDTVESTNTYLSVLVEYDNSQYVYTYILHFVDSDKNKKTLEFSADELDNLFKTYSVYTAGVDGAEASYGFYVASEVEGYPKTLTYSSVSLDIISISVSTEGCSFGVLSIGTGYIKISCDEQSVYLRVEVEASENFNFEVAENYSIKNTSTNFSSLTGLTYTYDGANLISSADKIGEYVSVTNVKVTSFGGNFDIVVEYNSDKTEWKVVSKVDSSVVILTIIKDSTGWVITRASDYLYVTLNIEITLKTLTSNSITTSIYFTNSITVTSNSSWTSFYAGTTVQISEEAQSSDSFSTNAVFKILNETGDSATVELSVDYAGTGEKGDFITSTEGQSYDIYTFGNAGTYTFTFSFGGTDLLKYKITVVENLILDEVNTIGLTSDTEYSTANLKDIFTLYQYQTGTNIVYGDGNTAIYSEENKQEVTEDSYYTSSSLTITATTNTDLIDFSSGTLTIGHVTDLMAVIDDTLTLTYNGTVLGTIDVEITNLYADYLNINAESITNYITDEENKQIDLMAYTTYDSFITMNYSESGYTLYDVTASVNGESLIDFDFEIDANNNTFKITKFPAAIDGVVSEYKNIVLTFTFINGEHILTISTDSSKFTDHYTGYEINLVPYIPDFISSENESATAYSESSFDLLNNVFAIKDNNGVILESVSDYISSIIITVDSSDADKYFSNYEDGTGYNGNNNSCPVTIASIVGDSVTISVYYEITYSDDSVYNYTHKLIIYNYQNLILSYPMSDLETTSHIFRINDDDNDGVVDGKNMGGTSTDGTNYTISNFNFTTAQIGETITLECDAYDENYSITRVSIENRSSNGFSSFSIASISLIGYSSNAQIISYVNNGSVSINNTNHTIKFNSYSSFGSGNYGYFVFKITTNSGQIGYYYVYLYNSTSYSNVSYDNSISITYTGGGEEYLNDAKFLGQIVTEIASDLKMTASASNLSFYLLEADLKGDNDFFDYLGNYDNDETYDTDYSLYSNLSEKFLPVIYNYLTLKIGVLYKNGNAYIYLGSVTFYITPNTLTVGYDGRLTPSVTDAKGESVTSEYTAEISSNETEITNPFTVKVGDDTKTLSSGSILSTESGDISSNAIKFNDETTILTIGEDGKINIEAYVSTDLVFVVEYRYAIDTETLVLTVTYTLKGLTISTATAHNIGDTFSTTSGFNNSIELSDVVGSDDYQKDVYITLGSNAYTINMSSGEISENAVSINGDVYLLYLAETNYSVLVTEENESCNITISLDSSNGSLTITFNGNYYTASYEYKDGLTIFKTTDSNDYYITISSSGLLSIYNSNNDVVGQANLKAVFYKNVTTSTEGENATVTYTPTLIFSLASASYTIQAEIVLTDIDTKNVLNIQFNVQAGYQLSQNTTSIGASVSNPYKLIIDQSSIDYSSNTGSSLTFTYSYDTTNNYYTYTFKDDTTTYITIYTSSPMTLSSSGADSGYIASDEKDNDSNYTVNFVHLLEAKTMAINITVYDASGVNVYNSKAIQFYVTIPQTYTGLSLVHSISGADHDNVDSNEKLEDLYEYFFSVSDDYYDGSKVINEKRVAIIGLDGKTYYTYSYVTMGFNDSTSPNYVEFAGQEAVNVVTTVADNVSSAYAQFSEVNSNTLAYVYINLNDYQYKYDFQIMANSSTINYKADTYDEDGNYVTFLVDSSSSSELVTDKNIFNLVDERNSVFYVTSAECNLNSTSATVSESTVTKSGYIKVYYFYISDNNSNYELYLKLDEQNKVYVSLSYKGASTCDLERLVFTVTLYGDGGVIVEGFKIVFLNYTVTSTYNSSSNAQSVTSSSTIEIGKNITIESNITSSSTPTLTCVLDTSQSYYSISNTKFSITSNSCDLFTYNEGTKILTTDATAETAYITLVFKVTIDGYYAGTIEYHITLTRNFEFYVNGSALPSGNSSFTTDYSFVYSGSVDESSFEYTDDLTAKDSNVDYSYDLLLEIKAGSSTIDLNSYLIISEYSGSGYTALGDDITLNRTSITFNKDFSGTLHLVLTVNLGSQNSNGIYSCGSYSVDWIINVTGFVTLNYKSNAINENTILTNNSSGFTSGSAVTPIDSSSRASASIKTSISMSNSLSSKSIEVKAIVSYVVLNYDSTSIDAVTLFNEAQSNSIDLTSTVYLSGSTANTLTVNLPSVAQSSYPYTMYLVIYKIQLSYLGQTTDEYYVSYLVYSSNTISTNKTQIDVDSELSDNCLQLFYYAEVYTSADDENVTVTLAYNGENKIAIIEGLEGFNYTYIYDSDKQQYVNDDDDSVYLTIKDNIVTLKYYTNNTRELKINSTPTITSYSTNSVYSLTTSIIEDLDDFIDFIDQFKLANSGIKFSFSSDSGYAGSESVIYFKLTHIANGVFGIDLSTFYQDSSCETEITDTNSKLFNNSLLADISIVISNNDIFTISAYSTSNTSGFRLTTKNEIKPNGTLTYKVSDIFPTSYITLADYSKYDIEDVETYYILGVAGTTSVSVWLSSKAGDVSVVGGDIENKDNLVATIKVPGVDTDYYIYYLYKVYVYVSSDTSIYNLNASFYAIVVDKDTTAYTGYNIIVINYSASLQAGRFDVTYTGDDAVFNYSNILNIYTSDDGVLKKKDDVTISSLTKNENDIYSNISNGTITVSNDVLRAYKNSNQEETYLQLTYTLTYNNKVKLAFDVRIYLPSTVTASIDTSATASNGTLTSTENTIDLSQVIRYAYYTEDSSGVEYTVLSDNLTLLTDLTEVGTSYSTTDLGSATITFETSSIATYFVSNTDDLEVNYSATFNGAALTFKITIKNVGDGNYSYSITQTN